MGLTASDINSSQQEITVEVRVDGRKVSNLFGVDVSMGLSQVNSEATVHFTSRPSFAEEKKPIEIWAGYNGKTEIIFKGELTGTVWEYFPGVVTLEARGPLARLRLKWGGEDRTYSSQDSGAVIQNAVEAMGISSSQTHIESSGTWTLGTAQPVVLKSGEPFWPTVEEIDKLEGYRTYTDRAGVIRRGRVSGNVGGGGHAFSYAQGENITRCRRRRTNADIINYCQIVGLNYLGYQIGGPGVAEAWADNPFVPDPPRFQGPTIQSNLVEDNDTALSFARRTVADGNRRPEVYEAEVFGNPKLDPLRVIALEHDEVETGSGRFVIDRVQHTIRLEAATFRTNITTLGGNIVATETNLPPLAVFDLKLFQEAEDTGSGVESRIVVIADGSASSDPDGDTLTYDWSLAVDAGSAAPATGSDAVHRAVISGAATELTVTLTVTDADGATGVLGPLSYPLTAGTLYVEPLYLAWQGGLLEATGDGEQNWGDYTVAGGGDTDTPPFAADQGSIWGDETGEIFASIDYLATDPVSLGSPHGAVACTATWVHELDSTRIWAAFADGAVYSGVMDWGSVSATWEARGTVPDDPVVEIREAVGTFGSLRATAGAGYYSSEDGGETWVLIDTFVGAAARMAAGFEENLASGTGDPAPLYAETGTLPTVPMGVTDIPALTIGWREPALYAADDAGGLYTTDDTFAALTLHADSTPARVNHMIRSGNADGVIYLAVGDGTGADNGLMKWIPGVAAPWWVRKMTDRALLKVGYGPARRAAVQVRFVVGTYRLSGALDGFWLYDFGTWARIAPPQSNWAWLAVAAHPYNARRWLALGMSGSEFDTYGYTSHLELSGTATLRTSGVSPLWLTDDAGATWQEVPLPGTGLDPYGGITAIGWQEQSGRWFAVGDTQNSGGTTTTACYWTGSRAGDARLTRPTVPTFQSVLWCASGASGEFLASEEDSPGLGTNGRLTYIPNDGATWTGETWKTNAIDGWNHPRGMLDTIRGTRAFWQVSTRSPTGIVYWTDYRETDPASDTSGAETRPNDATGAYQYLAVGDTHLFINSNESGASGIYRRLHASWEPTGAPDYPISGTMYGCVTDRQSRRLMVSYVNASGVLQFVGHDGNGFAPIALPHADFQSANAGYGAIYKDNRGCPFAAMGEAPLP